MFWKVAYRNLKKHKRRHLLSGSALVLGFCGLVLLGGYMIRMEKYLAVQTIYLNHTGHISIYQAGGLDRHLSSPQNFNLKASEVEIIKRILKADTQNVEYIGSTLRGAALVSNGCTSLPVLITAIDNDFQTHVRTHPLVSKHIPELKQVKQGQGFWERPSESTPVNVSTGLARSLGKPLLAKDFNGNDAAANIVNCKDPDRKKIIASDPWVQIISTSFLGGVAAGDAEIAGYTTTGLSTQDETALTMSLQSAQTFFQTDMVTNLSIYLKEGVPPDVYSKSLFEELQKQGIKVDFYLYDDERVSQFYVGAMNFVYVMVGFFIVLVCGVVILSILNALNISLLERKSEIATLRAIGFKPFPITKIFLHENLLLGAICFAAGGLFAIVIQFAVNTANFRFTIPGLSDDLQFMLDAGLGFSLLVALALLIVVQVVIFVGCWRFMKQKVTVLLAGA